MNQKLQQLLDSIQQSAHLSDDKKNALAKTVKDADKELEITNFELDRTEKVKRTTAILLEETIAELEQKRKSVEEKNHELEIETALEKVRTVAMSMRKPDDMPDVCRIISEQLEMLKVKDIRNVQTAIFYEAKGTYINYEFYTKHDKTITTEVDYKNHSVQNAFANQMIKGPNEVYTHSFEGDQVKEWYEFQKTTNVFIDTYLENVNSLNYYWHSLGPVALGISTYSPLNQEENKLFRRFLKVFELAYRRYLDIEKAEAQAREAQIELALERVRARTMAMQKSDELAETSFVLFRQFKDLGETSEQISIGIFNEDEHVMELYSTLYGSQWKDAAKVDLDEPVVMKKIHKAWKEQKKSLVIDLSGKHLREYNAYRKKLSNLEYREDRWVIHIAFFSKGALTFSTTDPHSAETIQLLERFAGVFDQTYTRFLDLKKAEAQARESQIELGLERVRARAMAMQKSDELKELIGTVYNELTKLDLALDRCLIWVMNSEDISSRLWMANAESQPVSFYVPHHDNPPYLAFVKAWKDRDKRWQYDLHGQVKKEWDAYVFNQSEMKHLPDPVKKNMQATDRIMLAASFHNFGCLQTAGPEPLKEEQFDILNRFAKVFDLTYTRFNDLQKAEAQAREAQIELGLERVRARAMAMQKSDELSELVDTVFKELTKLDFALTWCIINIIDESSMSNTVWAANPDINKAPESYHMLFEDYPFHDAMMKGWKERRTKYVYTLEGSEKKIYDDYLFSETEFRRTPEAAQAASRAMEKYVVSFSFSNFGGLQTVGDAPLSDANLDILSRFGKVFDLTYTRFNDLKQAEAQARESQIQLALERVRARTMAMQHSDELKDAAALLFQQAKALGVPAYSCGYNIWEKKDKTFTSWMSTQDGSIINGVPNIPLTEDANFIRYVESKQKGEQFFVLELRGERMQEHYKYLKTIPAFKAYFDYAISVGFDLPETQIHYLANFSQGNLLFISLKPCPEFHDVFKRFAAVFEQTYTRFLDLQKSEAQARESQIQLALERVRARTMAMQKSNELSETVFILFQQFKQLGENPDQATIGIINEEEWVIEYWVTMYGNQTNRVYKFPIDEPNVTNRIYKAWKEQKKSLVIELSGKELYDFATFRESMGGAAYNEKENKRVINVAFFSKGIINVQSNETRSEESIHLLERFAGVFEQTYTRFLDLQKAEAQAREAQIEAALERVRSRSMGMQKSEELKEVIQLVYEQFIHLNIYIEHTGFLIDYKVKDDLHIWLADQHLVPSEVTIPYFDSTPNNSIKEAKEKGQDFFTYHLTFEEKNKFYRDLFKFIPGVPEESLEYYLNCPGLAGSGVLLENIGLYIENFSGIPYTDEENNTLMRFGKVFQQTYTRFLDLQKAETQAREAKIEAALEKVRSRSLAMHKSDELKEAGELLWNELGKLGIESLSSGYVLMDKQEKIGWIYAPNPATGKIAEPLGCLHTETKEMLKVLSYWKKQEPLSIVEMNEQETIAHQTFIAEKALQSDGAISHWITAEQLIALSPKRLFLHNFNFKQGYLMIVGGNRLNEEQIELMSRFTKVFQQTYTRFLDLQKAEAQGREAQIEAALERVRSRTMAMQNSDELAELVATVFTELNRLEFALTSCIIWINNPELLTAEMWVASTDLNKPPEPYYIKPFRHPYFKSVIDAFKEKNKKWVYQMNGEEKKVFQEQFFNEVGSFPTLIKKALEAPQSVVYSASFYNFGALEIVGTEHLTDEKFEILHRLGKVFDMSYTRFNDLKQAEAQAREARIEAALERVRSRTLAMQKSDELAETAAVLFGQLIYLGIAPNRLYIGIIHDDTGDIEAWATDEEGGKINNRFTLSSKRNASIKKMYDAWKHQEKSIIIDMQGKELIDYISYLSGELQVPVTTGHTQQRRVQNIAYFGKGFIGIASPDPQPEETIELIERFAAVFNLTYTRFNDLKAAEAHAIQAKEDLIKLQTEKKRAEDALAELQITQRQLIQSEKMASLGELTAGIAHEIQNPLNFVNNFSEVNKELLVEMKDEMDKGNIDDAKAIANDVIDNQEKINHHGKRADAIVKGMLQHSRSSTGVKEPTDINALADEYLRLAYHGLRAKNKSFNATMKTDYDETLEKINVIPQDIGRVILNLITNAFYAVNEKVKKQTNGYEPTISVSSKKTSNGVTVTVSDNGNGIPQKVVDKIFQPFFTTKPTGEGTGLGLSLSYDIIKAHGGEIKVETKEGEGSKFIIELPVV